MTPLDVAVLVTVSTIVAMIIWHAWRADKRDREKGRLYEPEAKTKKRRKH